MNHIVYLGKAAEPILILAPSALWDKSLRWKLGKFRRKGYLQIDPAKLLTRVLHSTLSEYRYISGQIPPNTLVTSVEPYWYISGLMMANASCTGVLATHPVNMDT